MGRVKKKELPMWVRTGHKKPVTRRDFLAHGLIPFAAAIAAPTALGLVGTLGNDAMAQAMMCPPDGHALIPFVHLHLSGGAALAGNFVPMDATGSTLTSYTKLGLGMPANFTIAREFNNAPFYTNSQILTGLRATASPAALGNTAFVAMCAASQSDTASNRLDISGLVARAGVAGSRLPSVKNGGQSTMPNTIIPPAPLNASSFTDLQNSLGYTAALRTALNDKQRGQITKLVSNLNSTQARKLASLQDAASIRNLIECAGVKNIDRIAAGSTTIDPRQNAGVATAWNVNNGTAANNQSLVFGSLVYNGLNAQAGTVMLTMGGYDYHDNTRGTGDAADNRAGQVIGRILETAQVMGKPLFLYVTSDGSIVSDQGVNPGTVWRSDRNESGMAYMMMIDPKGRPSTSGFQLGHFMSGDAQAVDSSTPVGNNVEASALAVFANYLAFNQKLDLYSQIVTGNVLPAGALKGVVKVG